MTDLPHSGVRASRAHPPLARALHLFLLALPLGVLVACGGGEEEEASAPPSLVRVDAPPSAPAGSTSSGTDLSGTLHYRLWGSADVATGAGATASAQVAATPVHFTDGVTVGGFRYYDTSITFAPPSPFAAGLQITDAYRRSLIWHIQNSSGAWENFDASNIGFEIGVVKSGGVSSSALFEDKGLLGRGNFFVFCSARPVSVTVTEQIARSGAQVAVSGNFVPMDNVAALYGKSFNRFDCAETPNKTTFGDGKGHLTMSFDGITLSEAQTVQAFSSAGYAPAAGQIIKRRAYSAVINGVTRTIVVALDNRAYPYASVLYQTE